MIGLFCRTSRRETWISSGRPWLSPHGCQHASLQEIDAASESGPGAAVRWGPASTPASGDRDLWPHWPWEPGEARLPLKWVRAPWPEAVRVWTASSYQCVCEHSPSFHWAVSQCGQHLQLLSILFQGKILEITIYQFLSHTKRTPLRLRHHINLPGKTLTLVHVHRMQLE